MIKEQSTKTATSRLPLFTPISSSSPTLCFLSPFLFSGRDEQRLLNAAAMFLEVVQKRDFPEFLTTYLNLDHTFLSAQDQGGSTGSTPRAKL